MAKRGNRGKWWSGSAEEREPVDCSVTGGSPVQSSEVAERAFDHPTHVVGESECAGVVTTDP